MTTRRAICRHPVEKRARKCFIVREPKYWIPDQSGWRQKSPSVVTPLKTGPGSVLFVGNQSTWIPDQVRDDDKKTICRHPVEKWGPGSALFVREPKYLDPGSGPGWRQEEPSVVTPLKNGPRKCFICKGTKVPGSRIRSGMTTRKK